MRSYDFVEMFKKVNGLGSDYKVAQRLGITRQSVSLYKNGRPLDEELALEIAHKLDIPESEVMIVLAAERSKTEEGRKALLSLSKIAKESGFGTPSLLISLTFLASWLQQCILCKIAHARTIGKSDVGLHTVVI